MIEQAARDFNMSRERSWLIGDTSVDIETARRAGLRSILVETGYAGFDYRTWAIPDAIVPDLGAAVSYILDQYPRLFVYCSTLAKDIGEGAVVLIGGQSRGGKSTFASVLRDAIRARGKHALILSVDRWLKSERERDAGVFGRYDMTALQALVDTLGNVKRRPAALTLPGYHKLKRERLDSVETISLRASDIILLEGTVSLALETAKATDAHRFHIEIDEASRKQRVLSEYRLRGFDEAQALEVYLARRNDEVPIVEGLAQAARRIAPWSA